MKSCGLLLRILLAIFSGMYVFSCNCEAASACPVRAVRMVTSEGVKCVCKDAFYGEKCQYRAHNSLAINASWVGMNEVQIQWQTEERMESYHLFARKVIYVDAKFPIYGKWKARMQLQAFNGSAHEEANERMNGQSEEGNLKGVAVLLRLNCSFSWEIRVLLKDNKNKSGSIFIDPPLFGAYALQNNSQNSNRSEADKCPFYRCPEQTFGFITFFEDFTKPCFKKGLIIGVVTGVIATVIISAVIYSVVRLCTRFCCKKEQKAKFHPSSVVDVDASRKRSCSIEIHPDDGMSVKSLFITSTLSDVIEVVPKSASVLW